MSSEKTFLDPMAVEPATYDNQYFVLTTELQSFPYKKSTCNFTYENGISKVKVFQFHMCNANFICEIDFHT